MQPYMLGTTAFPTGPMQPMPISKRKHHKRVRWTSADVKTLAECYAAQEYPSRDVIEVIAGSLECGATFDQVRSWFYNERRRRHTSPPMSVSAPPSNDEFNLMLDSYEKKRNATLDGDTSPNCINEWWRCRWSKADVEVLEAAFQFNRYILREHAKMIVLRLDCIATVEQVMNWFHAARQRNGLAAACGQERSRVLSSQLLASKQGVGWTASDFAALEAAYKADPHISRKSAAALAATLDCKPDSLQVVSWFGGKRRRRGDMRKWKNEGALTYNAVGWTLFDIELLETAYKASQSSKRSRAIELSMSTECGATPQQVISWFSERRRKDRVDAHLTHEFHGQV